MKQGWILGLLAMACCMAPSALLASEYAGDVAPWERSIPPWEEAFEEAFEEGRKAYNSGDFEGARDAFRRAAQIDPTRSEAYRNLARSLNMLDAYGEATHFYDHYLDRAEDAEDRDQVEAERQDTARRAGDDRRRLPTSQRMARRALEREMWEGRIWSEGESGALGLFEELLETGYAEPDLEELRGDLERRLEEEILAKWDDEGQWLPVLGEGAWERQRQRALRWAELVRDEERLAGVREAMGVVDIGMKVVTGEDGEPQAEAERVEDRWGLVPRYEVGLAVQRGEIEEAVEGLDGLMEEGNLGEKAMEQANILRVQLRHRMGEADETGQWVEEWLDTQ